MFQFLFLFQLKTLVFTDGKNKVKIPNIVNQCIYVI